MTIFDIVIWKKNIKQTFRPFNEETAHTLYKHEYGYNCTFGQNAVISTYDYS